MTSDNGGNILLVDDDTNAVRILSAILSSEGYNVDEAFNVKQAIMAVSQKPFHAIISDVKMPDKDGFALFDYIKEAHPEIPLIFLTAFGSVESAVNAMGAGAYHYFIKPPNYPRLLEVLRRAVDQQRVYRSLTLDVPQAPVESSEEQCESQIIGESAAMKRILEMIANVSNSSSSILITGETGTGKELVAKELHYGSCRKEKPFVPINCAAIPGNLLEAELFGWEKGAFTGAHSRRIGKFEEVAGGTLFLDEIGELDLSLQAKILRVLQERIIERLGSNKQIKVDFRLVTATNKDLMEQAEKGKFRADLFYRINVVLISLPPLRERMEDIPLLAEKFLLDFCTREGKKLTLSKEVMDLFQRYSWPGNVRQLQNVVERAVALSRKNAIIAASLPEELRSLQGQKRGRDPIIPLKDLQIQAILDAIQQCGGNKSKAAKMLGISRKAFYKRLHDHGVAL